MHRPSILILCLIVALALLGGCGEDPSPTSPDTSDAVLPPVTTKAGDDPSTGTPPGILEIADVASIAVVKLEGGSVWNVAASENWYAPLTYELGFRNRIGEDVNVYRWAETPVDPDYRAPGNLEADHIQATAQAVAQALASPDEYDVTSDFRPIYNGYTYTVYYDRLGERMEFTLKKTTFPYVIPDQPSTPDGPWWEWVR